MIVLDTSATFSTFPLALEWNIPDETFLDDFLLTLTDEFKVITLTYSLNEISRDFRFVYFDIDNTNIKSKKRWDYKMELLGDIVSSGILRIK
jgi:hypothetical protein